MSVDDAPLRSVLWSHDSRVVIFPPFESYPQISSKGFTDLRAYVAAGNNLVFMGSYIALQVQFRILLHVTLQIDCGSFALVCVVVAEPSFSCRL
jgi:hypothetical protein